MKDEKLFIHKIRITQDIIILVDKDGRCSTSAEGALGCVVQGRAIRGPARYALKIPRLLADTMRENAYVEELLLAEDRNVRTIDPKTGDGLLHVQAYQQPLRIPMAGGKMHIILVCYEKNSAPRFASVSMEGSELKVTPPDLQETIAGFLTPTVAEQLLKISSAEGDQGCRFFCIAQTPAPKIPDTHDNGTDPQVHGGSTEPGFRISDSLPSDESVPGWYGMVPSIIYDWADASLQEAASTGMLKDWGIRELLVLGRSLLNGLQKIHSKELLHADIRPANIMFSGDARVPSQYGLIDYGSFGRDGQSMNPKDREDQSDKEGVFQAPPIENVGSPGSGSDHSLLGPSTLPQRASPFYAPERREGIEHESADTAVILFGDEPHAATSGGTEESEKRNPAQHQPASESDRASSDTEQIEKRILVQLGWKSHLLDDENQVKKDIKEDLEKRPVARGGTSSASRLQAGDRLRIRDLVLEVVGIEPDNPNIIHCSGNVFRVFHDRLAVKSGSALAEGWSIHSVPRVIELCKVSAATDLYGIGAVLLYTAFAAGRPLRGTEVDGKESTPDESAAHASQSDKPGVSGQSFDADFESLMKTLNNRVYFNAFWDMLDELVQQMEAEFSKLPNKRSNNLSAVPYARKDGSDVPLTLGSQAENVALLLVATSTGLERVLNTFKKNTAHFCLFMHFILALLQRRSELKEGSSANPKMPFAQSRIAPPCATGPTAAALAYIVRMSTWVGYEIDHACVWSDQLIDPKTALGEMQDVPPEARAQFVKLQASLQTAKDELAAANKTLEGAHSKLKDEIAAKDELAAANKTLEGAHSKLKDKTNAANTALEGALGQLTIANGALEGAQGRLRGFERMRERLRAFERKGKYKALANWSELEAALSSTMEAG